MIKWDRPCYKCRSNFCDLSCEEPKHLQAPQRTAAVGEDTRRAWVGLTDEEINDIVHNHDELNGSWELIDMVEAKLRSKNEDSMG